VVARCARTTGYRTSRLRRLVESSRAAKILGISSTEDTENLFENFLCDSLYVLCVSVVRCFLTR
jgi:hypothetical protein